MKFIILIIFLGLFFWLVNFKILSWSRDWPIILIVLGLVSFLTSKKVKKQKIIEDLHKGKITVSEAIERLEKIK